MTPSQGAKSFPSDGSMAMPFPNVSFENTSSFTSERGITFPETGAYNVIDDCFKLGDADDSGTGHCFSIGYSSI